MALLFCVLLFCLAQHTNTASYTFFLMLLVSSVNVLSILFTDTKPYACLLKSGSQNNTIIISNVELIRVVLPILLVYCIQVMFILLCVHHVLLRAHLFRSYLPGLLWATLTLSTESYFTNYHLHFCCKVLKKPGFILTVDTKKIN